MSSVWVLSIVLQWAVIVVLCVLVLSVVRQLGLISLRLERSERPGSEPGPAIGTTPASYSVALAAGEGRFALGGPRPNPQLLVFFSPHCGTCKDLPAALQELDAADADVLVALGMEREPAAEYVAGGHLEGLSVALLEDVPGPYYVPWTPSAIALGADGTVVARGRPHGLADLEGLLAVAVGEGVGARSEPAFEVVSG